MTAASVIAALCLPADARVDHRVPKNLLVENGAPTAADKRQINDGIEELLWLAALKSPRWRSRKACTTPSRPPPST